jgi:ribosomal protein S18 acetylase RimI-like enzyme
MSKVDKGTVTIRPMMRSDIHDVLALDRKLSGGHAFLSHKDMAATEPGGPLDLSFIAEIDGKIVGFIISRIAYLMIPLTEVCLVQGILVDPDHQEHGIGSKLFEKLLDFCNEEGIHTVRSLVDERNNELRRLVERLGFRKSNIINYDKNFES